MASATGALTASPSLYTYMPQANLDVAFNASAICDQSILLRFSSFIMVKTTGPLTASLPFCTWQTLLISVMWKQATRLVL